MKTLRTLLMAVLTAAISVAQFSPGALAQTKRSAAGHWEGALEVPSGQLDLIVDLAPAEGGAWKGTINVPAQGIKGYPLPQIAVDGATISFAMAGIPGDPTFKGKLSADGNTFSGELTQGGATVPFKLARKAEAPAPAAPGTTAAKPAPAAQTASTIPGVWQGTLEVPGGIQLRLVLKVTKGDDGALKATVDSPDQGAMDMPVTTITQNGDAVSFEMKTIGGAYEGTLNKEGSQIAGQWKQGGGSLPLTLKRVEKVPDYSRPQDPKKPLPYDEEDVTYSNKNAEGVTLAATLTLPRGKGPFPAALLITGSGPQDRNEALLGHRPFLVLADHLTRKGIAVLRADDRGIGKSTGKFGTATTEDFASDALAGVEYLKSRREIDAAHIGLIGHSEGGLVAPMAAVKSTDVAFIVLMAGPGVTGQEILALQSALIAKAAGASDEMIAKNRTASDRVFEILRQESDNAAAEKKIREVFSELTAGLNEEQKKALGASTAALEGQIKQVTTPWFRYFLTYDPRATLKKVKCPVLAVNGELDLQVPPNQNLPEITAALTANSDYEIVKLPKMNHLFQTCQTGSPSEYAKIEETISPAALEVMSNWIVAHTTPR